MGSKIYLATPYTAKKEDGSYDWDVMIKRFNNVNICASILMGWKYLVFSPITHCHPLALINNLPKSHDYWKEYNYSFLVWCDELHVFACNGWDKSVGVKWEIEQARHLNKKIKYVEEDILKIPLPVPRYDDIYFEGVKHLDSL